MDYFEKLSNNIKLWWKKMVSGLVAYIRRLIFPVYLFPLKLVTYSTFYMVRLVVRLLLAFIGLVIDTIIFPFRSLKNLLKAIFLLGVGAYLFATLVVIGDYLHSRYGSFGKFWCSIEHYSLKDDLKNKVVRIVGGESQGSGFFIDNHRVLTNFHVISGEPAPKIIFSDGRFITPIKMIGEQYSDLAILTTEKPYPDLILPLQRPNELYPDESLLATGYPLGTAIKGEATIQEGKFHTFRRSKTDYAAYVQTDINLIEGMSGGPLVEMCGRVVGVNTMGLSGLSMFVSAGSVDATIPNMTDKDIAKITLDPSKSPEEAVAAFYTYLKARRMQDGFNLLSRQYLMKTNFEEWTGRFGDVLDVWVIKTELYPKTKDTVFVKFSTQNWVDEEIEEHYYEGTWKTIKEDGVYKMLQSNIKEVLEPGWFWAYE